MANIGMYVSALMGGSIKIQFITKSEHAICHMDINDAKRLLRRHTFDCLRDRGLGRRFDDRECE